MRFLDKIKDLARSDATPVIAWILGLAFLGSLIRGVYQGDILGAGIGGFIASLLFYGAMIAALILAIYLGKTAARITTRNWIGIAAGIVALVVFLNVFSVATASIPWIGWRVKVLQNSDCYTEYDGRTSSTECY